MSSDVITSFIQSRMEGVEFILFDFGKTLVYGPQGGYAGFEEMQKQFGLSDEQINHGKRFREAHISKHVGSVRVVKANTLEKERQHHRRFFYATGEAMGLADGILKRYTDAATEWRMTVMSYHEVEGVRVALQKTREKGFANILFTNAFMSRRSYIEKMGLTSFFDAIFISGEVGLAKPDPAFYEHVFQEQSVRPENGWIVDNERENVEVMVRLGGRGAVIDLDQSERIVWKDEMPYINHIKELLLIS